LLTRCSGYNVAVAVDTEELRDRILSFIRAEVTVLVVRPWGSFSFPLNALVREASSQKLSRICFMSVEMEASPMVLGALLQETENNTTLVAGASLSGHKFKKGIQKLDGLTSPWNTLAIWNVGALSLVGFPLVAEGDCNGEGGGVEEVSTIALMQHLLSPQKAIAKLIRFDGTAMSWQTVFNSDPKRLEWHHKKMNTKLERAEIQLEKIGLQGVVHHLDFESRNV